ncbi:type III-A CRISPR-associated RAMP protein Csm4, partial [Aquifex sp.]
MSNPFPPFKSFPESFTLFGSVCWGVRILYGKEEVESMLEEFRKKPPFILSSPLPKIKGNILFPKPLLPGGWKSVKNAEEYKDKKAFKRVNYVDTNTLLKILRGEIKTEKELWEEIKNKDKMEEPIKRVNVIHAQINRISWTTSGGTMYNEETTFIAAPFSVYIYFYDTSFVEKVKAALRFSQLGGNKSTGMGYYEVSFVEDDSLRKFIEERTSKFITLSPVFPEEHFELRESYYDVFPLLPAVEGFYEVPVGNFLKKRFLYMSKG